MTVLVAVLAFLFDKLSCGQEFKGKIISALKKYESVLIKYSGRHSLSANSIAKLV